MATRIYDIKPQDLMMQPSEVASVLYRDAPLKIRQRKMKEERFKNALTMVREVYIPALDPAGFTRDVEVKLIRKLFEESLPPESPIYKVVEEWLETSFFIVTIGKALEESVHSLQEQGRLYDALFVDAAASVLVEEAAQIVTRQWARPLLKKFPDDMVIYPVRYSPGYCSWNVKAQVELFGYMADLEPPVTLTPASMMHPRKSVSGILAMEKASKGSKLVASCRVCDKRCRYARTFIPLP